MSRRVLAFALLFATATSSGASDTPRPVAKTIADMRTMAAAVESYALDHRRYPPTSDFSQLVGLLVSKYLLPDGPILDGWGAPYKYLATPDGCHYRILSAGADGVFEKANLAMSLSPPERRASSRPSADIVFQDNAFQRVPAAASFALTLHEERLFSCP